MIIIGDKVTSGDYRNGFISLPVMERWIPSTASLVIFRTSTNLRIYFLAVDFKVLQFFPFDALFTTIIS